MSAPKAAGNPTGESVGEVTSLLRRWRRPDSQIEAELISRLYPELRRIAQSRMRGERLDHTLQPTALVNEFFLHIAEPDTFTWQNRAHFLAFASQTMRRLLVDHARAHAAEKRGGGGLKVQLDELVLPERGTIYDLIELHDLLERLAGEEPRMAQVVEMRCFGGLTFEEIGETLDIDARTAKRDWQVARAWLFGQLRKSDGHVRGRMGTN